MKLQVVRIKIVTNATAAGLETDVNTFLSLDSQKEWVSFQYIYDSFGGLYTVMIGYTE